MRVLAFVVATFLAAPFAAVACSDAETDPVQAPPTSSTAEPPADDAGSTPESDAEPSADAGLTGKCADEFGDALTEGFGRIDGTLYAIQMPNDQTCAMPNRDHLIVQVLMNGAVYRMVVNVMSDRTDQDQRVRYAALPHALPEPAFAEGWHGGVALDYATTLDVHSDAFAPYEMDPLVAKVKADLEIGDPISVYATSGSGRPESAHLVHRNEADDDADGAIVIGPASANPKFLLFAFVDQTF